MENIHPSFLSKMFPWLSPIVLKFVIVDGGIEVHLYKNNQLQPDWHTSGLQRLLPESLAGWIEKYQLFVGPQPYPLIKQVWQALTPLVSKKFIIDSSALAELEEVSDLHDLTLVWTLNHSLVRIEGHYEGADRYLGMGWFQKGQKVWSLSTNPPTEVDSQLRNLIVPVQQVNALFQTINPSLQHYLHIRVDFQHVTDFSAQVIVTEASSSRLALLLQCNYRQLLPFKPIPHQQSNILISNQAIIRFSHQALTPVMLYLLSTNSTVSIQEYDIPAFIRQQLPVLRQYRLLSEDMATKITQAVPIVSVATLKPSTYYVHTYENSIGRYVASVHYTYQQQTVNMKSLSVVYQQKQRFAYQNNIWFEWPENSDNLFKFIQRHLTERVLPLEEVMGLDALHPDFARQQPIPRDIHLRGATPVERGKVVLEQLRYYGVPGCIIADSPVCIPIFINACENLLRDNSQARILWLVPSNKKGSVTRAINNSTIKSHVIVASPVTLRDEPRLMFNSWTLVIFQEQGRLWDEHASSPKISQLNSQWTLASVTSREQFSPSSLWALHVPEKYYKEFCSVYLFDLHQISENATIAGEKSKGQSAPARKPNVNPVAAPKPVSAITSNKEPQIAKAAFSTQNLGNTKDVKSAKSSPLLNQDERREQSGALSSPAQSNSRASSKEASALNADVKLVPSRQNSFWEQARRWKDVSFGPVPFVPCQNSYPIYTDMHEKELQWYFYWRNEVRNNRYPPTDVGYILMHVFEVLECIGFSTPQMACARLKVLWMHYRDKFPQLDNYLIPWIADFHVVYKLSSTAIDWYISLLTVPHCAVDEQLIAEAWLRQSGDWAQMPSAVLYKLAGLDDQPIFYQKDKSDPKLGGVDLHAIIGVGKYLRSQKKSSGLVNFYGHGARDVVKREPFKGALTEQTHSQIIIAEINQAFNNIEFRRALAGIVKYANYLQRKSLQNTTEAFAPTIDIRWQEAIETALRQQSLILLSNSKKQDQSEEKIVTSTESKQQEQPSKRLTIDLSQRTISHTESHNSKQTPQITSVPSTPSPAKASPVLRRAPETIQKVSESISAKSPLVPPPAIKLDSAAISKLQEESEKLLVRLLIEEETEHQPLNPRGISDPVFVSPDVTVSESVPLDVTTSEPVSLDVTVSIPEIDEDWQNILQQWQPEHWEIIIFLYQEQYAQLITVERKFRRPVSRLIDEINAPVDEQLGDLLVDPDTRLVPQHLHATVSILVNWYLSSKSR